MCRRVDSKRSGTCQEGGYDSGVVRRRHPAWSVMAKATRFSILSLILQLVTILSWKDNRSLRKFDILFAFMIASACCQAESSQNWKYYEDFQALRYWSWSSIWSSRVRVDKNTCWCIQRDHSEKRYIFVSSYSVKMFFCQKQCRMPPAAW